MAAVGFIAADNCCDGLHKLPRLQEGASGRGGVKRGGESTAFASPQTRIETGTHVKFYASYLWLSGANICMLNKLRNRSISGLAFFSSCNSVRHFHIFTHTHTHTHYIFIDPCEFVGYRTRTRTSRTTERSIDVSNSI